MFERLVQVCVVLFVVFIGLASFNIFQAMHTKENCIRAWDDAYNIFSALANYYFEHDQTHVPSLKTLEKVERLDLYCVRYLLGSSPETITIITSSEPNQCWQGKYYVVKVNGTERRWVNWEEWFRNPRARVIHWREWEKNQSGWVDEWPADIPNPNPEEDKHNSFFSWIERVFN